MTDEEEPQKTSEAAPVTKPAEGNGPPPSVDEVAKSLPEHHDKARQIAPNYSRWQSDAFVGSQASSELVQYLSFASNELSEFNFEQYASPEAIRGICAPEQGGIVVIICREDPAIFAFELAKKWGVDGWYEFTETKSIDIRLVKPEELAQKWVSAMPSCGKSAGPDAKAPFQPDHPVMPRFLRCKTVDSIRDRPKFNIVDPNHLSIISEILKRNETTAFLPITCPTDSAFLREATKLYDLDGSAICLALGWQEALLRRVRREHFLLEKNALDRLDAVLPYHNGRLSLENVEELEADQRIFQEVCDCIEASQDESSAAACIAAIVEQERDPQSKVVRANEFEVSRAKEFECQERQFNSILHGSNGLRDEVARAMLFVVSFCDRPSLNEFRELAVSVLPPESVDHPAQLGRGSREKFEAELRASERLGQERPELPSWTDAFDERFDETMGGIGLRLDDGRVVFSSKWSRLNPAQLIAQSHSGLAREALRAAHVRGAFFGADGRLSAILFGLFGRVDAAMPGTISVAELADAFSSVPTRERYLEAKETLVRDLGTLLRALFEAAGPTPSPEALGPRLVAHLAEIWRHEHGELLAGALLLALRDGPELHTDTLWTAIRLVFQRSDAEIRRRMINYMIQIVGRMTGDIDFVINKWMRAAKDIHGSDDSWDGFQIMLRDALLRSDIVWRARPFHDRQRALGPYFLGRDGPLDDADRGFLRAFFCEAPLLAARKAYKLMRQDDLRDYFHGFELEFMYRMGDVFWILADGVDAPDIKMDSENALFDESWYLAKICALVKSPGDGDLGGMTLFVMGEACASRGRTSHDAATLLLGLFPAALLAHWRFDTCGIAPVAADDFRFRKCLDEIVDIVIGAEDGGENICQGLRVLGQIQKDFSQRLPASARVAAAGVYSEKAKAFELLATYIELRRKQALSKRVDEERSKRSIYVGQA